MPLNLPFGLGWETFCETVGYFFLFKLKIGACVYVRARVRVRFFFLMGTFDVRSVKRTPFSVHGSSIVCVASGRVSIDPHCHGACKCGDDLPESVRVYETLRVSYT